MRVTKELSQYERQYNTAHVITEYVAEDKNTNTYEWLMFVCLLWEFISFAQIITIFSPGPSRINEEYSHERIQARKVCQSLKKQYVVRIVLKLLWVSMTIVLPHYKRIATILGACLWLIF